MYKAVIIGAGNIAAGFDSPKSEKVLTHAHAIMLHPDFELLGFYDRDEKKSREAAGRWGGKAFRDTASALRDADVVYCCVPDAFHGVVLKEIACFSPKLVVAEKPLASTFKEAQEIQSLYEGKIPLTINYSRRFLKEFHRLKKEIPSYGRFLKGVGYYGKGALHNGSHMVDILRFLLGEIGNPCAFGREIFDFEKEDSSKNLSLEIRNGNFYMMAIDSRAVTIFELELFFEKARARILGGGEKIEIYHTEDSDTYVGYKNYKLQEEIFVDYSRAMTGLTENAAGFLKGEQELFCTLKDGMEVLKICTDIRGELN